MEAVSGLRIQYGISIAFVIGDSDVHAILMVITEYRRMVTENVIFSYNTEEATPLHLYNTLSAGAIVHGSHFAKHVIVNVISTTVTQEVSVTISMKFPING